jgi:predicted transcriptional regulator
MIAFYPIKPVYTEKILTGKKTYELRKCLPSPDVKYILIYSTTPVAKVVAYAKVKALLKEKINDMWDLVSSFSGIEESDFREYFEKNDFACAIEFEYVRRFVRPFNVNEISSGFRVPQSFCYIQKNDFNRIKRRKAKDV